MDFGQFPDARPDRATLVFDGYCGFCTRSARWIRRLTDGDRLEIVASQQHDVHARTGVTGVEADRAVWLVFHGRRSAADPTPDDDEREVSGGADRGRGDNEQHLAKVGGARAIGLALEVGRNVSWPTVAWKVPGATWVLDRAYDVIAKYRHRLPGETPWCETHPNECTASAP